MRRIRGRRIGAIFQDPLTSLNPLYTIGEQLLETILTHLDVSPVQARSRAIALLSEVGIPAAESRLDHYPHQFSGGMRQRVVIALALCGEPRLIVADEPTTALDVSIQAQIITLLKRLARDHGTAVLLITHDMGVIAETADRVAVMYAGRIAEIGPVREVIHSPRHPYSVGLMGSIPKIRQRAGEDAGATRPRLVQIEGSMPRLTAIPSGLRVPPALPEALRALRSRAARTDRDWSEPHGLLALCRTQRIARRYCGLPRSRATSTSRGLGSIACSKERRSNGCVQSTACRSNCAAARRSRSSASRVAASRPSRG
jgi:peptide/nickel transport system ATP-binding protein